RRCALDGTDHGPVAARDGAGVVGAPVELATIERQHLRTAASGTRIHVAAFLLGGDVGGVLGSVDAERPAVARRWYALVRAVALHGRPGCVVQTAAGIHRAVVDGLVVTSVPHSRAVGLGDHVIVEPILAQRAAVLRTTVIRALLPVEADVVQRRPVGHAS